VNGALKFNLFLVELNLLELELELEPTELELAAEATICWAFFVFPKTL
jgi:hypothetical protein